MEILRMASNPWGQEVLVGIGWDLVWLAVILSVGFVAVHAVWAATRKKTAVATAASTMEATALPERIERHSKAARSFHWLMSVAMLGLLVTAFVPVLGLQFPWVTLHWIAGLLLVATVIYHVIHAVGWQDVWAMWMTGRDVRDGLAEMRHSMNPEAPPAPRAGKYPADHKLYHNIVVVVSVGAIASGLLMMLRVDTPLWAANPYLLGDSTWGWLYLLHGLSGVALIGLVTAHVYFAIRPEKRWITWSMIRGWIHRDRYVAHHDPARWPVPGVEAGETRPTGAVADATVSSPREDA